MRWLHSQTRITDQCQLIGIHSFAAFLRLELFWVSMVIFTQNQIKN
jgi:hypothetical protein